MRNLKNLTVSLEYSYPPGLIISASFVEIAGNLSSKQDKALLEATCYSTVNSSIYLFPVFKEIAERNKLKFETRYNTIFSVRRYVYAILIALGNYVVKTKGIEYYKENMKVTYDDGF
jgi:hypothetical protein